MSDTPQKKVSGRTCEVQLVESRISAWKAVIGQNFNRYNSVQHVCSDHFHSGISSLKKKINIAMVR